MKRALTLFFLSAVISLTGVATEAQDIEIWTRFEEGFNSSQAYRNPIYDVQLSVTFVSPTGRVKQIAGFWDGERSWKVRFMPDEKGAWQYRTECSDKSNKGLHALSGTFTCVENKNPLDIYQKGAITKTHGLYHLEHADGTPFFWTACTAWNGTLKSTDDEWKYYLDNRAKNHYSVIQFVTTQWRGGDKNSLGQVAFEGSGEISINPAFFQHLDKKIDQINDAGLVAAPVLLWALPTFSGRYLSPGYYLPEEEAIRLARYMVARYGANHVIWILGGDGKYLEGNAQRWKNIGRGVFGDEHPGLVALHPSGKMWLGDEFGRETWLDIIGYQTGHNHAKSTLNWITKGPVSQNWNKIPPKVVINMEPVYEEIRPEVNATDIRNASYWSVLAAPTAGITYGANGIWPWLREGEEILNHANKGETTTRWKKSLELPGSVQVGYLSYFFQKLEWWKLKPAPSLLIEQPGDSVVSQFISVSRADDRKTIVVYVPEAMEISLRNPNEEKFQGEWFDPVGNKMTKATLTYSNSILRVSPLRIGNDHILVLKKIR